MALRLLLCLCISYALLLSKVSAQADTGDVMIYSYMCLQANQDRCIGISPGASNPTFDLNHLYQIQVKDRINNEFKEDDYKKTRWNVDFSTKQISLSRFANLCITRDPDPKVPELFLYPCNDNITESGSFFNLTFNTNVDEAGVLQLLGTDECATVMQCEAGTNTYCNPASITPAIGNNDTNYQDGAYVKLRPCYFIDGDPAWEYAQVWRQRLDCAVGCPPYLQFNNVCDPACDNSACDWDNGECITKTPTLPTKSPTTSIPTKKPTTKSPTTKIPTQKPTTSPTLRPTSTPTFPILGDTQKTYQPTSSPIIPGLELSQYLYVTLIPALLLLLLLLCIFCFFFGDRNSEKKKKKKSWNDTCCYCCYGCNRRGYQRERSKSAEQQLVVKQYV